MVGMRLAGAARLLTQHRREAQEREGRMTVCIRSGNGGTREQDNKKGDGWWSGRG